MSEESIWRSPRSAQTTIPCKVCRTPLVANRSCQEVTLACPVCGKSWSITEYADSMDDALETFMERVPCDRV